MVLKKFDDYCRPRKNTLFERFKFWNWSQQEGETVDQFVTELKRMIKNFTLLTVYNRVGACRKPVKY